MSHDDQVRNLAEETARLLSVTGRVLDGVEGGNWLYLAEKAAQLGEAANRLSRRAELQKDIQQDGGDRIAGDEVIERVRIEARHCWLGRTLYPHSGGEG